MVNTIEDPTCGEDLEVRRQRERDARQDSTGHSNNEEHSLPGHFHHARRHICACIRRASFGVNVIVGSGELLARCR
jgi:hypothetical protein